MSSSHIVKPRFAKGTPRTAAAAPARRGRPADSAHKRFAIQQAMLAALLIAESGRRRATRGDGHENVTEAARRVKRLFVALGHPMALKTIKTQWYKPEIRPREAPTETALPRDNDDAGTGIPLTIRVAARILSINARSQGEAVTAATVLAWYRQRLASGDKPLLHPFPLAIAFHGEQKVSR